MNPSRAKERLMTSNIQKRKHIPQSGDSLYSIHRRDKSKTLWYRSTWDTMDASSVPTNSELVSYRSKIYPFHSLHRSVLSSVLPSVRVKDDEDVSISWCEDIFFVIVDSFRLIFNDTELQYGNNKLLFSDQHNISVNVPETEWCKEILSCPISMDVPFTYSHSEPDAFPLHLCGQNDRLIHLFQFNLDIRNLIIMKDIDDNIIDTDLTKLLIENNYESIPVPELEGLYTTHIGNDGDFISSDENNLFVNSMYYIEDDNEVQLGKRVNLKIDSKTNYPVEEIIWGALNNTQVEKYHSLCFTTMNGTTPIKTSKLESRDDVTLDTRDSFKTEYVYNSNNYIPGISRWRNSICDKDGKKFVPGIIFSGGKLSINTVDDKLGCKFVTFMILKYTKQYVFTSFPKTQQERLTKGATIELVNE